MQAREEALTDKQRGGGNHVVLKRNEEASRGRQ
jgi:hypothetical protein